MKSTYDTSADALYIALQKGKVANTVRLSDLMNADLDKSGNLLGIEILNASNQLKVKDFGKMTSIPLSVLGAVSI